CIFCLLRECWVRPIAADAFGVEHLVPKSVAPERICDYTNLVYACCRCNSCKGEQWPVPDPCETPYGEHLRVHEDGTIEGRTEDGRRLIRILRLDREELTRFRRELLELLRAAQAKPEGETAARVRNLLSFPHDLPDLRTLRPPGGNTKPEGVQDCYHVQ